MTQYALLVSSRRLALGTVAREVSVSGATVSNAYNRPHQLSERLCTEIFSAAPRLGYSGPALSLAMQRSGTVAVMLDKGLSATVSDPTLAIMIDSVASTVDIGDRLLVLMPGGPNGGGPRPSAVVRVHADVARVGAWLLTQGPPPTALLCMSDELALEAIRAAREIGLAVPTDLTIVGFDDMPGAAWADLPLTTVRQDLLEKGRRIGELVLRLLQGRGPGEPVTIGVALMTRASSGLPPGTRLAG